MSNLSDLLPAGGGAKVITATASGNLATGQTVILNSNGTVSVVAAVSESVSSQSSYTTTASAEQNTATYDSTNNRLVVIYKDGSDGDSGKAVVGTVSGSSISFGTPVQFETGNTAEPDAAFDVSAGKVVIVYVDNGDSQKGKAVVGTVNPSDNSISFGSIATFHTGTTDSARISYNTNHSKSLIVYKATGGSNLIKARVGTVSGTSISFGTEVSVTSGEGQKPGVAYDTSTYAHLVVYEDDDNSDYGAARVATISGTDVSFGTAVVFASATTQDQKVAYDSGNNKFVATFKDQSDSNNGKAIVGTVSGTDVSFGTEVAFDTAGEAGDNYVAYDATAGKIVVFYTMYDGSASSARYAVGTVSGTSISFASPQTLTDNAGGVPISFGLTYDSTAGKIIFVYRSTDSNNRGGAKILTVAGTNSGNFVGITNQAINNSASGEVVVEGGVITNSSMFTPVVSAGTPVNFANTNVAQSGAIAFDSTNNKVVIVYTPSDNSNYGTAVVGTVSGDTISFGSPVVFNSASTDQLCIAFDANAGKFVIGYKDNGASNYGKAIVGTVSGTSISFGSEAALEDAVVSGLSATYDANAQKVVIAYYNNSASRAAVGTVSGTSVSFGTPVTFSSSTSTYQSITYDSSAQKVVIAFTDSTNSNYPSGIVGTVSGTSISFGSATAVGSEGGAPVSIAYDSSNSKVVIAYRELASSPYGLRAVAGTVSGTSISFGSTASAEDTDGVSNPSIAYDASAQQMVIAYRSEGSGTPPKVIPAGVSGTSVTFGSAVTITSDAGSFYTNGHNLTYDSNAQRVVGHYIDSYAGNLGDAFVVDTTSTFTIGSTYYVQDDGTLSTTSSSVTAGKAIANTTLLLKG